MGQIVFNGQTPKYCNLTAITTGSKKDYLIPDGEIWLIDSTNTSKTDGTGKYDYYIKGDGSKTASQLAENKIKIDDSADVYTKPEVDDMIEDVAYFGDTVGNVTTADFNAQTDTVWNKAQVLSAAQQAQARTNINAQEALVSGTNIKTINNESILGSGNITISGGGGDVSGKEDKSNKVTSLSSSSTDTQYPSAKCVYDLIGDVESLLASI